MYKSLKEKVEQIEQFIFVKMNLSTKTNNLLSTKLLK